MVRSFPFISLPTTLYLVNEKVMVAFKFSCPTGGFIAWCQFDSETGAGSMVGWVKLSAQWGDGVSPWWDAGLLCSSPWKDAPRVALKMNFCPMALETV